MNDRLVWIDCEMTGLDIDHLTRFDARIASELPDPTCRARTNGSPVRLRTTHELRAATV